MQSLRRALEIAQTDPARARHLAITLVDDSDPEVRTLAERILGTAARVEDDMRTARRHLERSVEIAEAADLPVLAAESRLPLVTVLAFAGESDEALRHADLASPHLSGRDRSRMRNRRALLLQRAGRFPEALSELRAACAGARRAGDLEGEAQALGNRGLLHAYQGRVADAVRDLQRALGLFDAAGQPVQAADALHNLGFVAARSGDLATALEHLETAASQRAAHGVTRPVALLDRCEAMLAARLGGDARRLAEQAVDQLGRAGLHADEAEALLLLAEASLVDGDPPAALDAARRADALFRQQSRGPWAALAAYAVLRARWEAGDPPVAVAGAARPVADELQRAGWALPALDARVMAARAAIEAGRTSEALDDLRVASRSRRAAPAAMRVRAWNAEALLRHADGRPSGAWRALDAGMRAVYEAVATAGATELRVRAAGVGEALAATALRLAVNEGKPRRTFEWAERTRAAALQVPRARPPRDARLADLLGRLRLLASQIEEASFSGALDPSLLRRQAALEQDVRRRAWSAGAMSEVLRPPEPAALAAALGRGHLLEYVEVDGRHWVVALGRGRMSLHPLGSAREAFDELDGLRFALGRMARPGGPPASRAAAGRSLAHAAGRLDDLLLAPVRHLIADDDVVVVPTGALHSLPWSTLPTLHGRPVAVTPSAAIWLRCRRAAGPLPTRGRVLLVAGPRLGHGDEEVADLAALHRDADVMVGDGASVDAVLRALDGSGVAHLVAHGSFRADNPLFSSVRLADGPLTIYDLERLRRPPDLLVLSACDVGTGARRPGEAVMGLAASVLPLGTTALVASVTPVDDAQSRHLMVRFHERLLEGVSPAAALSIAAAGAPSGFTCLGAG